MHNGKRRHQNAAHVEGFRRLVGFRPHVAGSGLSGLKRPAVHGPQSLHGFRGGVHGQSSRSAPAEGSQIVKPAYVIHMGMRVQHGIQIGNIFPQGLLTQIGRGIQQDTVPDAST